MGVPSTNEYLPSNMLGRAFGSLSITIINEWYAVIPSRLNEGTTLAPKTTVHGASELPIGALLHCGEFPLGSTRVVGFPRTY